MRFKCTRCKKNFNYKKDRVPLHATKEYCSKCHWIVINNLRLKNEWIKTQRKKKNHIQAIRRCKEVKNGRKTKGSN